MDFSHLQLDAIGAMNRELDNEHPLTHFSQKTKQIELKQIIELGIDTDLVENIYFLFPEKYNEFCFHPDYPLNCIKSITVEIISETTGQSFKIIYYPPLDCLSFNKTYNTYEFTTISDDNTIFIPETLTYDPDKNVFVGPFFEKQKIIICPLKLKTKTNNIKVSIQKWEETLLSLNINNLDNNLNPNIKNLINLCVSDPIHLKPIPIPYIGSVKFNKNTIIPDHMPKSESLDDVSLDSMLEERKLWSDYNPFTIKDNKDQNCLTFVDRNKYDQYSSHLFFVREMDLNNIEEITMKIGGNIICNFSGLWLQTRYEEYKNNKNNNEEKYLIDGYILLPIPPLYNTNIYFSNLDFNIKNKNSSIEHHPLIYFKSIKDQDNHFIPEIYCMSAIIQVHKNCISYYNETSSELKVGYNNLLCQLWSIVTYKNNICTASSPHPFLKLQLSLDGIIVLEESANYYHKVVPLFFEQSITQKYLIYRIMFQNTPLSFYYPVTKNPYEPAKFISNHYCHSTLNASKIENIKIKVFWDEEVIKQYYPETDQLKLYFFSESFNLLVSNGGLTMLRYL